jgi:outer membrane lipoprotein-sorting protein
MMRRRAFLLASVACGLAPRVVFADDSALDALLAKITKARASLRSLSGPFVQTRKIGLLSSSVKSTGSLLYAAPDRLRWELDPPDDVTYWVSKRGLAYRTKDGGGSLSGAPRKLADALDDLRACLGGDLSKLRARYTLEVVSGEPDVVLAATPKVVGKGLVRIEIALAPDLVRPVRVTLAESARDKTDVVFGAMVVNGPFDPARLRPPT